MKTRTQSNSLLRVRLLNSRVVLWGRPLSERCRQCSAGQGPWACPGEGSSILGHRTAGAESPQRPDKQSKLSD